MQREVRGDNSILGPYIYDVHMEGGQNNLPQIADVGIFKVRNCSKIADGGGWGSDFQHFCVDVINVWSHSIFVLLISIVNGSHDHRV